MESTAVIAQLGERKTEDLKVSGSIPDCGNDFVFRISNNLTHVRTTHFESEQFRAAMFHHKTSEG